MIQGPPNIVFLATSSCSNPHLLLLCGAGAHPTKHLNKYLAKLVCVLYIVTPSFHKWWYHNSAKQMLSSAALPTIHHNSKQALLKKLISRTLFSFPALWIGDGERHNIRDQIFFRFLVFHIFMIQSGSDIGQLQSTTKIKQKSNETIKNIFHTHKSGKLVKKHQDASPNS